MGYFSNGSEGECYREEYCDQCIHDINNSCPVWNAHLARNYKDCNDDASILHMLIPRTEGGLANGQCRMFLDTTLLSPLARERFQAEQATQE